MSGEEKCQSNDCDRPANTRVFWPGRPPMLTCIPCAARAQRIGDAMGSHIGVEELRASPSPCPPEKAQPRPECDTCGSWLDDDAPTATCDSCTHLEGAEERALDILERMR